MTSIRIQMTEELLNLLATIPHLQVAARTSAFEIRLTNRTFNVSSPAPLVELPQVLDHPPGAVVAWRAADRAAGVRAGTAQVEPL